VLLVLVNVLLFVVLLNPVSYGSYEGSGRVSTGVVLSVLASLPVLASVGGRFVSWFWLGAACWLFVDFYYLSLIPILLLFLLLYFACVGAFTASETGQWMLRRVSTASASR
jgi:hypothetical protein